MNKIFILAVFLIFSFTAKAQNFEKGLEAYKQRDYASALSEWRPLAEQGDIRAQNNIAVMYQKGQGTATDYEEAAKWYQRSAEAGNVKAQASLAWLYATGQGVTQDYVKSYMWFTIATKYSLSENYTSKMNYVREKMNTSEISRGTRMADEWLYRKYQK